VTSKERAAALIKEYFVPTYRAEALSNLIAGAIDDAVADERVAVLTYLHVNNVQARPPRRYDEGVGHTIVDVYAGIKRGDHLPPPKPRYEVRESTHRVYRLLNTTTGEMDDVAWNDIRDARAECERLNKEAKQ
jgi:hypothetical protein